MGDAADAVLEALRRLRGGRQLGAGDEELVLEPEDVGGDLGLGGIAGVAAGAGDAERRAGLVDGTVGLDPRVGLRAAPADQRPVVPSSPLRV